MLLYEKEGISMILLALAWAMLIVFGSLEIVKRTSTDIKTKKSITSIQVLFIILMASYSFLGIATKDPLSDLICEWTSICVPAVAEWAIYIGVLGFLVWKFILVDMKTNINLLQNENRGIYERIGRVEGNVEIIKENTDKIMQKCLNNTNCSKSKS